MNINTGKREDGCINNVDVIRAVVVVVVAAVVIVVVVVVVVVGGVVVVVYVVAVVCVRGPLFPLAKGGRGTEQRPGLR